MNREEIRAAFMNRKLKTVDFTASLPDLESLDGQLSLRELTAASSVQVDAAGSQNSSVPKEALQMGGMVIAALVTRDTAEQVFETADVEFVAQFGLSVLVPIAEQIAVLSGTTVQALADAKKN